MRIAFKNRTVHECTGVTLVSVTANIFLSAVLNKVTSQLPLSSGREAGTATSAKTGIKDNLDNFLGSHAGKYLTKCLISAGTDVLIDVLGIDNTTVTKSDTMLLLIEVCICKRLDTFIGNCLLIYETLNYSTLY